MCAATPLRLIKSTPYRSHKTGVAAVVAGRANDVIDARPGLTTLQHIYIYINIVSFYISLAKRHEGERSAGGMD